jgi:hypothetical protein
MKIWLSSFLVIAACVEPVPDTNAVAQGLGCDGPESYIDENGEEVICVYTDEPYDPPPDESDGPPPDEPWDWCSSFPEMCHGDTNEPPPPTDTGGGGGGGEPVDDRTCYADTVAQRAAYGSAMAHALCVIQTGGCNTLLSAPLPPADAPSGDSASRVLSDLHVKENVKLNCVAKGAGLASTEGPGRASDAIIRLRPLFYDKPKWRQVVTLLHELGHATGRIGSEYDDHDQYYPSDPLGSSAWNERIYEDCLAASTDRCGNPGVWPDN